MRREIFSDNLKDAINILFPFSKKYLIDELPENLQYLVFLNQSYDSNELIGDEELYPSESLPENRTKEFQNQEQTIDFLWRDGKIPEWINLKIHSYDENFTFVSLICCGRFTSEDNLLYHKKEGYQPFHVTGPSLPVEFESLEKSGKFKLAWHGRMPNKNEPYW